MLWRIAITLLIVLASGTQAFPQQPANPAQQFKEWCERNDTSPQFAICRSFIQGFLAGFTYGYALIGRPDLANRICLPAKTSPAELRDVFLKYAADHPERLHERTPDVMFEALSDAFQCLTTHN